MSGAPKRVRAEVLLRDLCQCVACGLTVVVEDGNGLRPVQQYSLQHRVARGMGGRSVIDEPFNLLTMCGTGTTGCHGRAEHDPEWARERGYRVDSWDNPLTVPVVVRVAEGVDHVYLLDGAARLLTYPAPGGAR